MAKRGPRTPWQERTRYLKARCPDRLKPNQVAELLAADAFARWQGFPLNAFATIRLPHGCDAPAIFRRGQDRFSKWLRRSGWELRWLYVWEARGPLHVHCLINLPRASWDAALSFMRAAFTGCDVDLRGRTP